MGRPKELSEAEREDLLRQGFVPVEVWVPDWNNPRFRARMQDEARRIAEADARDPGIDEWVVQVRGDVWDGDGA